MTCRRTLQEVAEAGHTDRLNDPPLTPGPGRIAAIPEIRLMLA